MLSFRNTKQTSKNVAEITFKHKEIINLIEYETIFQNNKLTANTFNKYFRNIIEKLSVPKDPCSDEQFLNFHADRVNAYIEKYKDHPSIICIQVIIQNLALTLFHLNRT